jgi:uncharacterized membrane protein
MMRRQADLVVTSTVAVLACVAAGLGLPVAVTAVFGTALLAAPGYLLGQLLFGPRVDGLEGLAVRTGLGLCVPILEGLVLAALRVPLNRPAWLGLLAATTLLGDLALVLRRRGHEAAAPGGPRQARRPRIRHAAAVAAAVIIAAGALGLARAGAAIQRDPGFTQLWLVRPGADTATVNLGVGNHEGKTVRYRLVLLRGGRPATRWDLTLANDQTWQRSPLFTRRIRVAADLYKLPDLAHPYRHVVIAGEEAPGS